MPVTNLNLVTVTGTYLKLSGVAAQGTVTFTPSVVLLDTTADEIIYPVPFTAVLDATGSFSINLPATNDPDLDPIGWHYSVVEAITGSAISRSFLMEVPYNVATIDMADVTPAVAVGEISSYLSRSVYDDHVLGIDDQHSASGVIFTPIGNISSNNVQGAIAELDSETSFTTADLQTTKANDSEVLKTTGDQTKTSGTLQFNGPVIVKADAVFDVRGHTGWDPIASDNSGALTEATTAAKNAGGGKVLLPRRMKLTNTRPTVPHSVDLIGYGALPGTASPSRVDLFGANAGIDFGLDTAYLGVVGSGGGVSGGFSLYGNNQANNPMRCAVGTRAYHNIEIENALQDGLILAATQNSFFYEVNIGYSARDNLVFDKGAGGNYFLKCENHSASRHFVDYRATAVGAGGVAYPLHNTIVGTIFEYTQASSGPMINHGAGQWNLLDSCLVVSSNGLTTMATPAMVRVAQDYALTSQFKMNDCTVMATTAQAALRAFNIEALGQLYLSGLTTVSGMGILYKTASNAVVREVGEVQSVALIAPATRVEGTETAVTRQFASVTTMTRLAGEMALRVVQPGDTQARLIIYGSGIMNWSPGSGAADVDWARKGVGIIGTAFNIQATGTIESTTATAGFIAKSPNGTRYRITVGDDGSITTTAL